MPLNAKTSVLPAVILVTLAIFFSGCRSQGNHLTVVDIPSGSVAGVATERGVLVLKTPSIRQGDVYPITQVYGNGLVPDNALVIDTDEHLALLDPHSSQLNNVRFLLYPLEPGEDLYLGVVDSDNEEEYIEAQLLDGGNRGDFIVCSDLDGYPQQGTNGYGGIGLYVKRRGYYWLSGILTPFSAELENGPDAVYPFVNIDKIWRFIPDLKDTFTREKKPFRPDFEYGLNRDGSGE